MFGLVTSKFVSVISTTTILTVAIASESIAATFNPAPIYNDVSRYDAIIAGDNDPADIYYPNPADLNSGNDSFPVALLLQGALVDKSFYSEYASLVARYGFIVVVPNHTRVINSEMGSLSGLLSETSQIDDVLAQMAVENANPTSPIAGIVDTEKLGLLGHSFGGAVGLSAIGNQCLPFLCEGSFTRPQQLKAGAFYGANLRDRITGEFIPIANSGIGVALLQGDRDGITLPVNAAATYNNIQTPPKALISILGANHFGITNINNPFGAFPDPNAPTLPQDVAIETVARWSALFLRGNMLGDRDALNYVVNTGDASDPNVSVAIETVPVSEPPAWLGLAGLGILAVASRLNHNHNG